MIDIDFAKIKHIKRHVDSMRGDRGVVPRDAPSIAEMEYLLTYIDQLVSELSDALGNQATRRLRAEADCDASDHGHEFADLCLFCGADAHEYFNREYFNRDPA